MGDGSRLGIKISYEVQKNQRGIADAFIIAEDWIAGERCILILGDNLFLGSVPSPPEFSEGAHAYAVHVPDPWRFGVAEMDRRGNVVSITEKPPKGEEKSDLAVVGLYVFDGTAPSRAKQLTPSARGELEITDLNGSYLSDGRFTLSIIGDGVRWMDAGTFDSLLESGIAVREAQKTCGLIGSPEIAALERGLVTPRRILGYISDYKKNAYWDSVKRICERKLRPSQPVRQYALSVRDRPGPATFMRIPCYYY